MGVIVRCDVFGAGKQVVVYEYLRLVDGMATVDHYEVEINVEAAIDRDGVTDEQWVRISPADARKLATILSSVEDEYEKGGANGLPDPL